MANDTAAESIRQLNETSGSRTTLRADQCNRNANGPNEAGDGDAEFEVGLKGISRE